MTPKTCPDRDTLGRLLLGKLPVKQRESLGEHLLHCEDCAASAVTLTAEDDLTTALQSRQAVKRDDDEILARVIERGKQLGSNVETVQAEETVLVGDQQQVPEPTQPEAAIDQEVIDILLPPEEPDEIGRLGGYRILEVLGVGGMGVVFRAEDVKLKRQVALKAMKPAIAASKSAKERFLQEAQAAAAIEHDHIVTIHQVGEDRGIPFIAMRYLRGESLRSRLDRETRFDQREVARLGRQIALGLAAAHEQGLIHRDIKPDNIWLDSRQDRVKIVDFGLVRSTSQDAGLTQSGLVVGTPKYMAPEQAEGETVDHRCDLFSLGSVLYHLVTGVAPFAGANITATLLAVARATPTPITDRRPDLPPGLADLIMRLLAKDPAERPQSAKEVAQQLAEIEILLESEPPPAPPTEALADTVIAKSAPESDDRQPPRRRLRTAIGGLAAIVLFGFVLFKFVTRDGTVFVELDAAYDIDRVEVDETTVSWERVDSPRKLKFHVDPGTHTVRMFLADGTEITTKASKQPIEIAAGGQQTIRAWLERDMPIEIAGQPVDLLKRIDLERDIIDGDWSLEEGVLVAANHQDSPTAQTNLVIPTTVPDEFVLEAEVERTLLNTKSHRGGLTFSVPFAETYFGINLDGWNASVSGITRIDNILPHQNETRHDGQVLPDGLRSAVRFVCSKQRVFVEVDGRPIVDWRGPMSRLGGVNPFSELGKRIRETDSIGLTMSSKAKFRIHKLTLSPLSPSSSDSVPAANYALQFDGVDDYVETSLKYDGSHPITIEARVTPMQVGDRSYIVLTNRKLWIEHTPHPWAPENKRPIWGANAQPGDRSGARGVPSDQTAAVDRRVHVAAVWDGSAVSFFLDGKRYRFKTDGRWQESRSLPEGLQGSGSPFIIGADLGGYGDWREPNRHFAGTIDEVRISSIARYTEDFDPKPRFEPDEHTLALYHFDDAEADGNTLTDASGNGHHGTIHGATWVKQVGPETWVPYDADRRAAEWVLAKRGGVYLDTGEWVMPGVPLPTGRFRVRRVNLNNCNGLSEENLSPLAGLQSLENLELARSDVVSMDGLHDLPSLGNIQATATSIDDRALEVMSRLHNLRELSLQGCQRITNAGVAHLKNLDSLSTLQLDYNSSVTDAALPLLKTMTSLRNVNLRKTGLTPAGIENLGRALTKCRIIWTGGIIEPTELDVPRFALYFDGKDDYADRGWALAGERVPMTFEAIVTPREMKDGMHVLNCAGFRLNMNGAIGLWVFSADTQSEEERHAFVRGPKGRVEPGRRVELAGVYDGENLRLFVDGKLVDEKPVKWPLRTNVRNLLIGSNNGRIGWFRGEIEQIRISTNARYDRDYEPADVYEADEETLALYRFDEGEGDNLVDASENGNNANVHGATWVRVDGPPIVPTPKPPEYALDFDGDDLVTFPSLTFEEEGPVTLEAWVRQSGKVEDWYAFILGNWDLNKQDDTEFGFGLQCRSDMSPDHHQQWAAYHVLDGEDPTHTVLKINRHPDELFELTHLAQVIDGNEVRLFVNGTPVTTDTLPHPIRVSSRPFFAGERFQGLIDELRISSVARYKEKFTPEQRFEPDGQTLGLYHVNDGGGKTLLDASGNGHHGRFQGATWVRVDEGPTEPLPSADGFALEFQPEGNRVKIPSLRCDSSQPFTVEAYVTARSLPEGQGLTVVNGSGIELVLQSGGSWDVSICSAQPENWIIAKGSNKVELGRRTHIAGVSTGEELRIYVDGVLSGIRPIDRTTKDDPSTFEIGGSRGFDGFIDDVRISDIARYTEAFTPPTGHQPDEHTLALYHFDEGEGTTLTDASGNGHHGTIHGATWVKQVGPDNWVPYDADRRVAEWVIGVGGEIVLAGMYEELITDLAHLPEEPFVVWKVSLGQNDRVTNADLSRLNGLKGMHHLGLGGTSIDDDGLRLLDLPANLTRLHVSHTPITDSGFRSLLPQPNMVSLVLQSTKIGDATVKSLSQMRRLAYLDLGWTGVTDASVPDLAELSELKELTLLGTKISERGVQELQKALPNCRILSDFNSATPKKTKDALSFDGEDDYVETPVRFDVTQPLTVEGYFTVPKLPESNQVVLCDANLGGFGLGPREDGKWRMDVQAVGGRGSERDEVGYVRVESDEEIDYGRRTHVAAVYDGRIVRLYVDGKAQSQPRAVEDLIPSTLPILIGANPNPDGETTMEEFLGTIDEVRISSIARYTTDFTPAERHEPDEHTLALYYFDEGEGTTLTDASGNGHHGTIHGATWARFDDSVVENDE